MNPQAKMLVGVRVSLPLLIVVYSHDSLIALLQVTKRHQLTAAFSFKIKNTVNKNKIGI